MEMNADQNKIKIEMQAAKLDLYIRRDLQAIDRIDFYIRQFISCSSHIRKGFAKRVP